MRRIGRYRLTEQLGQGGMGQVWRALGDDGQPVVVKTLHARLVDSPLFVELFHDEARITARLSHPGIVRMIDRGIDGGVPYLVMEAIDGCNLSALCRSLGDRRLPVNAAVRIAVELNRALGYAHDWLDEDGLHRPVVHGDISLPNVMVRSDGAVMLIDFGVAQMGRQASPDRERFVIGKAGYLAPELLDGRAGDERSDVFSAGVVLHELLTGKRLYGGATDAETLRLRAKPPSLMPPSMANSSVPSVLDAIVMRALESDPRRRFPSASELAEALERMHLTFCTREQLAGLVAHATDDDEMPTHRLQPRPPSGAHNTATVRARIPVGPLPSRKPRRARPVVRVALVAMATAAALLWQPSAELRQRVVAEAQALGATLIDKAVDLLPPPESTPKIEVSQPDRE